MQIKKLIALAGSAVSISFLAVTDAKADDSSYLATIASNTTNILSAVNGLPAYINTLMTGFVANMTSSDQSQNANNMRVQFTALGSALTTNTTSQNGELAQLFADQLGVDVGQLTNPKGNPAVLGTMPSRIKINALTYATALNSANPLVPSGAGNVLDYIENASGFALFHVMPLDNWNTGQQGSPGIAQSRYISYYRTVNAVQSYDAYILSNLWAESQNGYALTTTQTNLLNLATNGSTDSKQPGWLAEIGGESIGAVIRQILLFESQSYVLLTQLMQIQKQQLAATAMTNTLLIMNAWPTQEMMLYSKAANVPMQ